jgi:hypothetical protein
MVTSASDRLPGVDVECRQVAVAGRVEHAPAGRPQSDTTVNEAKPLGNASAVERGIVYPPRRPGSAVDAGDLMETGRNKEVPVECHWRPFEQVEVQRRVRANDLIVR